MIKKTLIFMFLLIIVVVSGCSNDARFEFDFDDFNCFFYTTNTFEKSTKKIEGLSFNLLNDDIIATYTQTKSKNELNEGYIDSIIILKKTSSKDLDEFVTLDTHKTKLKGYIYQEPKTTKISCNEQSFDLSIVDSTLEGNINTTFFTQAFIKKFDQIFIVSFSSQNENERNSFNSNIDKIKCK